MRYAAAVLLLIALPCRGQSAPQAAANPPPEPDSPARKAQPPRRLSDAVKSELAACLKKSAGKFSVMAVAGDSEAYIYARDWWEVFVSAGWQTQGKGAPIDTFHIGGGDWSGMRVSMHQDSAAEKRAAKLSPDDNFARCVEARRDIPAGGRILRYPERPSSSLSIQVSTEPQ